MALVETIDRLVHREGYTLKGARKALQGGAAKVLADAPKVASVAANPAPSSAPANAFAHLIAIRNTLVNALHDA